MVVLQAMSVCILTANLGNFDTPVDPVGQLVSHDFYRFTNNDFPPIAGLTPRLQYRIPKTHGWEMKPDYSYYLWLDGSVTLKRKDCLAWYLEQLGGNDIAFFRHPNRTTIREEVQYLEVRKDHPYIKSRYENGLHREQLVDIYKTEYEDDRLFASTAFIYRNTKSVQEMLKEWLYTSVRYFTCDQVALPYLCWKYDLNVTEINMDPFKNPYLTVVSRHK